MGRRRTISDEQLLAIARTAFIEYGPAASTREIAKRANISEGVIFQRFRTKAELYFAAMAPPVLDLKNRPIEKSPPNKTFQRLESLVRRLVEYFRETVPVMGPLMTQSEFRFEEFARRHPESSLVMLRHDLMMLLTEEQQCGNLAPGPVGPMALLIISIGQTIAVFEHLGTHDTRFSDEFIRAASESLWRGLAPD